MLEREYGSRLRRGMFSEERNYWDDYALIPSLTVPIYSKEDFRTTPFDGENTFPTVPHPSRKATSLINDCIDKEDINQRHAKKVFEKIKRVQDQMAKTSPVSQRVRNPPNYNHSKL